MTFFKKIFRYVPSRVWFIVTAVMLVLFVAVNVAAASLYTLFNIIICGPTPIYADGDGAAYEYSTSGSAEALEAANKANEKFCEEGFVLLKNDGSLPIATPVSDKTVKTSPKVSVFGKNSVNLVYGGSGSSGSDHSGATTIEKSLVDAGYAVNPALTEFYKSSDSGKGRSEESGDLDSGSSVVLDIGETPVSSYSDSLKNTFSEYSDLAVIVLSRVGGEGFDLPKTQLVNGKTVTDKHYLEPDENELALIDMVEKSGFKNILVVINSSSALQLTALENDEKINSVIWVGAPGDSGIAALGRIINGSVNPSGHTADLYAASFKDSPSFVNFGCEENIYDLKSSWGDGKTYFTEYEEGIYVGYRYYETRAAIDGEEWYNNSVVYPFGYGLSYTSFSQKILNKSDLKKVDFKDDSFSVSVEVENTGSVAGKSVVQLYITPPYTTGGIEKSAKVLVGYSKTEILKPGESVIIEVEVTPYYFSSYDYDDANANGFYGYELEKGEYVLSLGVNSHDSFDTVSIVSSSDIKYEKDTVTGTSVVNRFENASLRLESVMSRENFDSTFPVAAGVTAKTADNELIAAVNDTSIDNPQEFKDVPTQGKTYVLSEEEKTSGISNQVTVKTMSGKDYDDKLWDDLLDQITVADLANLFNKGAFTTEPITSIGKYTTVSADGPTGFTVFMGGEDLVGEACSYCSEVVIASSWNKEIAREQGLNIGEEGLWGNTEKGKYSYSGIYAPGVNIHRSPFGGRNGEYYSEDPLLSGMTAAYMISGAAEKGVVTYMKHFALNEQETKRMGVLTWVDEQTMREVYLKSFEIAIKESNGAAKGVMSSFNRIGTRWAGGSYALLTEVLRDEWGFRGAVICDFNTNKYMNIKQMLYAGGDLNLATNRFWSAASSATSAGDVTMLRNAAHNVLYAVANSNAYNKEIVGEIPPLWLILLIVADCVDFVSLTVWGVLVIRRALKQDL